MSNIYYSKMYLKKKQKKNKQVPLKQQKKRPPGHLCQVSIWMGELGILDIDI